MKRTLLILLVLLLPACSGFGLQLGNPPIVVGQPAVEAQKPSPESQIVFAANAVTAAATLGTTLLKNDKIKVDKAQSYKAILDTAAKHIHKAAADLKVCRDATGSKPETRPDPCAPTVASDIALGLAIADDVAKTLNSK